MPRRKLKLQHEVEELSILDVDGQVDTALEPALNHDELLRIYRAMVLTRELDDRMLKMQRQGRIGTFAPCRGQEATQIGYIYPMQKEDWVVPSYRAPGAQIWRGWHLEQILLFWNGYEEGARTPEGVNDLPVAIPVGSHPILAAGIGMGMKLQGTKQVVLTAFGDGSTSEGDVLEAFNFAGVYQAPVVFVCENNQYAISLPRAKQTRAETIAQKALAFGYDGIKVDGNDVLAMIVVTTEAVNKARRGDGPTLIEAFTYRMQMHTTADDPKKYRSDEEVKEWEKKCPLLRFEKYLINKKAADEKLLQEIHQDVIDEVQAGLERFEKCCVPQPDKLFDYTYAQLTPELQAQKEEFLAILAQRDSRNRKH
ncbi:MAG: Pyruvate dehydrogenase E1 component subunit alpha [Phycisphaerae bacterium]|nr:Pyruvate dehydrogenase E1 component subunit alpha [Phycisphaerae bacterium]